MQRVVSFGSSPSSFYKMDPRTMYTFIEGKIESREQELNSTNNLNKRLAVKIVQARVGDKQGFKKDEDIKLKHISIDDTEDILKIRNDRRNKTLASLHNLGII